MIAKIPNADPERFSDLLKGNPEDEERDYTAKNLREIIFQELDGEYAARDMPDLVVSVTKDYLLCSESDLAQRWDYRSSLTLEPLFGIKDARRHGFDPPSAYRGPFLSLLHHHSNKGLDLIIDVFNHSADWYAYPRVQSEYGESPLEIELIFADGTSRKQWTNARLWNLYRGTSIGPYVLKSILMALEHWLLEYAEAHPDELDQTLLNILQRSNSGALTAVVASVATAFPHSADETLLVLLRSRQCIELDRQRLVNELWAPTVLTGILAIDKIYEDERKQAATLPHRQRSLETAIINLQSGPLAPRDHEILDQSLGEQNEEEMAQPSVLQEVLNANPGQLNWGRRVFENRDDLTYDSDQWRQRLQTARDSCISEEDNNEFYSMLNGTGFVVAVYVRDHWDEMSDEEREWCIGVICSEVNRQCNNWNNLARVQRNMSSADRACAWVLPLLMGKSLPDDQQACVHQTLVVALTHAINEVRSYSAWGIGQHLWTIDRELALGCVNTLAKEAMLAQHEVVIDSELSYEDRRSIDDIEAKAASIVRERFNEANWISEDDYREFGPTWGLEPFESNIDILRILEWAPTESVAIEAFEQLALKLVGWWDAEKNRRGERTNPHTEVELENYLQNFLLRTSRESASRILQPILNATERHPSKVCKLVRGLIFVEIDQPNTSQFWSLWKLFADRVRQAPWLERIDNQYGAEAEMISAIFLGNGWKEGLRHWRSLKGYAEHIHSLFEDLPPSSTILDAYVRFLHEIGEQSLPDAFIRIAAKLREGDPKQMMEEGNTVFHLEVLLQRYVYWRPLELKRQKDLREAVLFLLDSLIEIGSSAAFQMRDDFVTPLSNT